MKLDAILSHEPPELEEHHRDMLARSASYITSENLLLCRSLLRNVQSPQQGTNTSKTY